MNAATGGGGAAVIDGGGNVKVFARFRPLNEKELQLGEA